MFRVNGWVDGPSTVSEAANTIHRTTHLENGMRDIFSGRYVHLHDWITVVSALRVRRQFLFLILSFGGEDANVWYWDWNPPSCSPPCLQIAQDETPS